jgi:hypothetical protein
VRARGEAIMGRTRWGLHIKRSKHRIKENVS